MTEEIELEFSLCEECFDIDACNCAISCLLKELLEEDVVKQRGESPEQLWGDTE